MGRNKKDLATWHRCGTDANRGLFYAMFCGLSLSTEDIAIITLRADLVNQLGTTMEQSELPVVKRRLADELEIFNATISQIPEAAELGVTDYESAFYFYWNYTSHEITGETSDHLWEQLSCMSSYYVISDLERIVGTTGLHQEAISATTIPSYPNQDQERLLELADAEGGVSFVNHTSNKQFAISGDLLSGQYSA